MKLSFIGSGNVAWHLAQAFEKTNHHSVVEVYSKTLTNAKKLVNKLYNAEAINHLDLSQSAAEVFFICVPDDAIQQVSAEIKLPKNVLVLHTSGTIPLDALSTMKNVNIGVFYPLQTFTKAKSVNFLTIPICLEVQNQQLEKLVEKLAFTICENVAFVNSNDRKILHLGAVFACNFTNHLLSIAKQILEKEQLEFKILQPLIEETIQKAFVNGPEKSQTGPAIRNDTNTITSQLQMLEKDPALQNLYELFTQNIQQDKNLRKK